MPLWGRPPGAKGRKGRRRWEEEQESWRDTRVEELDSDDTDTQGVGLNFEKKRFASDPLHFTGIDMSSSSRARKGYTYDSDTSDSGSGESDEGDGAMQIALRDKEEALVQSALARIRRAQEKGKSEVKLNPEELEALERRRKRMQAAATTKERNGSGSGSERERRRRSDRQLVSVPLVEPKSRKGKSKRVEDADLRPSGPAAPPGMLVAGADGVTYAPLGYYPPPTKSTRESPTRPRSATSQQLRATPPPQFQYQGQPRHYSENTRPTSSSSNGSRRPLPDEEGWMPNSRRSSGSSQSHIVDPFEYQVDPGHPPPIPQQYAHGRRIVSGPPEVAYSSVRRSPPVGAGGYPAASWSNASDPTLRRKSSNPFEADLVDSSSGNEEGSDDLGNGVQVYVDEREADRERTVPRRPVGGRKKGKR